MGISTWTWGFSFSFKKKNENKARVEIPKRAIYWSLSFLATQENARWGEQSQITSLPTLCFLYHMLRRIQFTCWSFASSQCEKTYCDISSLVTEPMFFFFFLKWWGWEERRSRKYNYPSSQNIFESLENLKHSFLFRTGLSSLGHFPWWCSLTSRTSGQKRSWKTTSANMLHWCPINFFFSSCHFMYKGNPLSFSINGEMYESKVLT